MSFLQTWILFALPLAALPVIIHLINQYRHRTVQWGAMQFLLSAKRMNRGMARLKQILVLAMRVLAVLGLIFAISRPLASGWFGVALGGSSDTTIILLDRSASMEQTDSRTGESKRETGLRKIQQLLEKTASGSRIVLIDSVELRPEEVLSPKALFDLPNISGTATRADIPAMLQRAFDFMIENEAGRTDVWILSDLRASDWDPNGGRWDSLRSAASELDGLRINLLTYPETTNDNLSVHLSSVSRRAGIDQGQLLLDLKVQRSSSSAGPTTVPVGFVVNGVRTALDLDLNENELALQGYALPIDSQTTRGWGRIELPNDSNQMDNVAYFVFSEPAERLTTIVSSNRQAFEPMQVAASTAAEAGVRHDTIVLEPEQTAEIDWENSAMILWQAPLPDAKSITAQQLQNFVEAGRSVIFFPPERLENGEFLGAKWEEWQRTSEDQPLQVGWWRPDSDLLENTQSGSALPVGELEILRYCTIGGTSSPLARIGENIPVLSRIATDRGRVYFCGVLPQSTHSTLARDGVVFYVMLQRALMAGANGLSSAQVVDAGKDVLGFGDWARLAGNERGIPGSDHQLLPGAFESGQRLRATNWPPSESDLTVLDETVLAGVLTGLDYQVIKDQAGGSDSLANEIWRAFIITMALALLVEAILCLPTPRNRQPIRT
tara:strand:- start:20664 stop:22658 length:1995 start_codon:yes stop_codon:yes gene_type:complete